MQHKFWHILAARYINYFPEWDGVIKKVVRDIEEFFIDASEITNPDTEHAIQYDAIPVYKLFSDFKRAMKRRAGPPHIELNGDCDYTKKAISYAMSDTRGDCIFSAAWTTTQALQYHALFEKKMLTLRNPNLDWNRVHARFRPYKAILYMPLDSIERFSSAVAEGIVMTAEELNSAATASRDAHHSQCRRTE